MRKTNNNRSNASISLEYLRGERSITIKEKDNRWITVEKLIERHKNNVKHKTI